VSAEGAGLIEIEVAYSPRPGLVDQVALRLPAGSTVADALQASGLLQRHSLDPATLRTGVWCKPKDPATTLRERDRVEIYRPLLVDPKEARRQRYKRHRAAVADPATQRAPGSE
jgi:putative ubiquitin-RnfH superfamily antitoxin RatB of RatAB toxin-antitoxin module